MTVGTVKCAVIAGMLLVAGANIAPAQVLDSNETGLGFLRAVPDAANAALGGAGLARPDGAEFWMNPSHLALAGLRSVRFSHTEFVEGITQEYAAISLPTARGGFGASVQLYDSGDIDGRTGTGDSAGEYGIRYVAVSFGYARRISDDIAVGAAYKNLFEKVSDEDASGYAVDAGIMWRTPVTGLSAALAARNFGSMDALMDAETKLPSDWGAGVLYRGTVPGGTQPFSVAADYLIPRYGDGGIRLGVELEPVNRFLVRAGYRSDSDTEDVSFGIGLNMGKFTADASFTPTAELSGNTLRFTLSAAGF